ILSLLLFLLLLRRPPSYTLFPYMTLFRSPISGVSVTFTAPASGASGTFAGTGTNVSNAVVSNASGVATAPVFTANSTAGGAVGRSEEHTSELQSRGHLVCRLLLEKKNFTP